MSTYYVDTSALAKRYLAEGGSRWVRHLLAPSARHVIVVCDLTAVEFFSLLARRQREGTLTAEAIQRLQTRFLTDFEREFLALPLENTVMNRARALVSQYPLRSLDSIQLASAIEARTALDVPITFVSADKGLLVAADLVGFATDNPNLHLE